MRGEGKGCRAVGRGALGQALQTPGWGYLRHLSHPKKLASRFLGLYRKYMGRYKKTQNFCRSSKASKCTTHTPGTGSKAIASHRAKGLTPTSSQLQLSLVGQQVTTALPTSIATKPCFVTLANTS